MKICCSQEHYDKVVQYAKSINDKAPYSFGFRERYPDGNTGIVGGLLYHGNPDESFAVTMERFHGWSIHT